MCIRDRSPGPGSARSLPRSTCTWCQGSPAPSTRKACAQSSTPRGAARGTEREAKNSTELPRPRKPQRFNGCVLFGHTVPRYCQDADAFAYASASHTFGAIRCVELLDVERAHRGEREVTFITFLEELDVEQEHGAQCDSTSAFRTTCAARSTTCPGRPSGSLGEPRGHRAVRARRRQGTLTRGLRFAGSADWSVFHAACLLWPAP